MLKVLPHSILVLVVLFSQIYNSLVVAGYELNYDYYSQELCENKDKPALHCEGKCMLSKQLAVQDDSQNEGEAPVLMPSLRLFAEDGAAARLPQAFETKTHASTAYLAQFPAEPLLPGIDHPPRV